MLPSKISCSEHLLVMENLLTSDSGGDVHHKVLLYSQNLHVILAIHFSPSDLTYLRHCLQLFDGGLIECSRVGLEVANLELALYTTGNFDNAITSSKVPRVDAANFVVVKRDGSHIGLWFQLNDVFAWNELIRRARCDRSSIGDEWGGGRRKSEDAREELHRKKDRV
jgi:hypothetical protein